jgi:hypothetical protein
MPNENFDHGPGFRFPLGDLNEVPPGGSQSDRTPAQLGLFLTPQPKTGICHLAKIPMNIKARCPHCSGELEFEDTAFGTELVCPHCRRRFTPTRPAPGPALATPRQLNIFRRDSLRRETAYWGLRAWIWIGASLGWLICLGVFFLGAAGQDSLGLLSIPMALLIGVLAAFARCCIDVADCLLRLVPPHS